MLSMTRSSLRLAGAVTRELEAKSEAGNATDVSQARATGTLHQCAAGVSALKDTLLTFQAKTESLSITARWMVKDRMEKVTFQDKTECSSMTARWMVKNRMEK